MELSFRIKTNADIVFDYLSDMQKFTSVHPVIFQIDKTGTATYLVHERLRFGFIPVTFTYPATVEKLEAEKIVVIKATVMKVTKIEIKFCLLSEKDFTTVNESIQFHSPLPVKAIMKNIFRKQHTALFKNIELKAV